MISQEFVTAGRAVFTLSVPPSFVAGHADCKGRYTFRIVRRDAKGRWPVTWFVNLLTGPDNTTDYMPLGILNPETGAVRLVRSTTMTDKSWPVRLVRRVLACIWHDQGSKPEDITGAGFELRHEGRCGRCGRRLTVPESIDSGLGPTCAAKA